MPVPGYLTFVDQSATLNGSTTGISVAGSLITADYSTTTAHCSRASPSCCGSAPSSMPICRSARGSRTPASSTWNNPPQTARASVSIDVGGIVGVGILNGTAWHDANFNGVIDVNERLLEGWTVELYRNDRLVHSAVTDVNGVYRISGVVPNYQTAYQYELRFVAPGAGPNTAKLGRAPRSSRTTCSASRISSYSREQPAESGSADRAERRGLQHDLAHAHSRAPL